MEPLKEMFNKKFFLHLAEEINKTYPAFDSKKFLKDVTSNLEELSLNQRMRKASETMHVHLPNDYKKTVTILRDTIPNVQRGYVSLLFPDYIGVYGRKDIKTSLEALKYFTTFGSSEFAIREFLKLDFDKTLSEMKKWAKDKDHHVRRLSSEGSRPRLPWSFKLDEPIKNPYATKEVLEALKEDDELYVRKSVANHLNDISKDNPDAMLAIVKGWGTNNKHTSWIIKHAARSLIKKGNQQILSVFKFEKDPKISVSNFSISKKKIKLGERLKFNFELESNKNKEQNLVIDYAIHYKKLSGELAPKVFKLKELKLQKNEKLNISKEQLFKDFTTRKHNAGLHKIEILINGTSYGIQDFHLLA